MSDKVRVTRKEEGQYCGGCCHFKYEDTDGWGFCAPLEKDCESSFGATHCSNECTCDCFASEEFKRRQLAVLRKCQRCLQKNVGTPQALDVEDICFAIDFLVDYAKLY
jgi:hypothetical protein